MDFLSHKSNLFKNQNGILMCLQLLILYSQLSYILHVYIYMIIDLPTSMIYIYIYIYIQV